MRVHQRIRRAANNSMIYLFEQGQYLVFTLLVIALIISLTFHEFGHAFVARLFGDDTAQRAGRLTLNPLAHIDPVGLIMVVLIGIGYAKPVPTDPRNYSTSTADLWVAAAGPFMNLVVATVSWNFFLAMRQAGVDLFMQSGPEIFFVLLAKINLVLMVFNLIPIGPLDGNYILPHFLPNGLAARYRYLNARYGTFLLLGIIALSFVGVPIFQYVSQLSNAILPWVTFVG